MKYYNHCQSYPILVQSHGAGIVQLVFPDNVNVVGQIRCCLVQLLGKNRQNHRLTDDYQVQKGYKLFEREEDRKRHVVRSSFETIVDVMLC